ncbi:MAG: fructose-bisphosphatase class II [candidate division Zixibacteria bacterium]|nr:fructose-bisphosphatase class II [candidate division Zixibacteria bacterium]
MDNKLRFDVADQRIEYTGEQKEYPASKNRIVEFNHRHSPVLDLYDISLMDANVIVLDDKVNTVSNLGALRNRKLRESVILSAALSAVAVGIHGRGSLNSIPKEQHNKSLINELKRVNDRTAAQVMSEVLQRTTETLPVGEEVIVESTITEGVRAKPGKEVGGNPTIGVGALFGKSEHRASYGGITPKNISLLSMGNDVIDGTTKSVKGLHSSLTALFLIEDQIKRHLPDIYVQRWMSGAHFKEFNPRETSLIDAAKIIADSYGHSNLEKLSSFFIDRKRHLPAMDTLNKAGVAIPYDADGDLFPALILGLDGLNFPNSRSLNSMIGEIGGSAEWAVGVLPLVWRGGQALGMLTSHSSLTKKDTSPEELWNSRFHYTEEELMLIQDARFQQKPYFSIYDIIDNPFAGGISAFGSITDNIYIPFLKGVTADPEEGTIQVSVLVINSLGITECWLMKFKCHKELQHTADKLRSPKEKIIGLKGKELENAISRMLDDEDQRRSYRIFFNNEYYPASVPIRDKLALLNGALDGLIERGALKDIDREIVDITHRLAPEWWVDQSV